MKLTPQIVVIDPCVHTPELDAFNQLSSGSPFPCTYHMPAMLSLDTLPKELSQVRGVIIMGSAASVNDNLPWQAPLEAWVMSACEAEIPVLGLCYGHQMLAHMFGGKVSFMFEDQTKLKGVREITLLENSVWQTGAVKLIVTHREAVAELPACMIPLACSPEVPIDGLLHKTKPIFGFQSHPEATIGFLKGHEIVEPQAFEAISCGRLIISSFFSLVHKFEG